MIRNNQGMADMDYRPGELGGPMAAKFESPGGGLKDYVVAENGVTWFGDEARLENAGSSITFTGGRFGIAVEQENWETPGGGAGGTGEYRYFTKYLTPAGSWINDTSFRVPVSYGTLSACDQHAIVIMKQKTMEKAWPGGRLYRYRDDGSTILVKETLRSVVGTNVMYSADMTKTGGPYVLQLGPDEKATFSAKTLSAKILGYRFRLKAVNPPPSDWQETGPEPSYGQNKILGLTPVQLALVGGGAVAVIGAVAVAAAVLSGKKEQPIVAVMEGN